MKEHKSGISRGLFLISMLLVMCAPVVAQHSGELGGNWNNPAGGRITAIIVDRYARRRSQKKPAVKHASAGSTTRSRSSVASEAAPTINDASVRFRSTGTQLKTGEIANLISPGDAQVLTVLTTILQEFDKEARKIGKPNDLALALSFFFATNASVYHDAGVPPDPQLLELRDTIAAALVEGNALNSATDRQKQEMYEALVLYTGLALASYEEGKEGNAESLKIGRQLAGQNLQAVTGISPDKINFTDQGLSIEREAMAADNSSAAPGDTESSPGDAIEHWVLLREYRDNEVAASARYDGKRVTIVGAMDFVIVENGQPVIRMSVPAWSGLQMFCIFPASQKAALARLAANQQVVMECTVRGHVGGFDNIGRITLDRCSLK